MDKVHRKGTNVNVMFLSSLNHLRVKRLTLSQNISEQTFSSKKILFFVRVKHGLKKVLISVLKRVPRPFRMPFKLLPLSWKIYLKSLILPSHVSPE